MKKNTGLICEEFSGQGQILRANTRVLRLTAAIIPDSIELIPCPEVPSAELLLENPLVFIGKILPVVARYGHKTFNEKDLFAGIKVRLPE